MDGGCAARPSAAAPAAAWSVAGALRRLSWVPSWALSRRTPRASGMSKWMAAAQSEIRAWRGRHE